MTTGPHHFPDEAARLHDAAEAEHDAAQVARDRADDHGRLTKEAPDMKPITDEAKAAVRAIDTKRLMERFDEETDRVRLSHFQTTQEAPKMDDDETTTTIYRVTLLVPRSEHDDHPGNWDWTTLCDSVEPVECVEANPVT